MESITLKEIAGHLPDVEILITNYKCDYVGIERAKVNGHYFINDDIYLTYVGGSTGKKLGTDCKLILNNLSMLIQEIEHNGEKLIPIVEMIKELSLFDLSKCEFELSEEEDDLYFVNAHEDGRIIDWLSFDGNLFEHERVQHECFELLNKYHLDWKYNLIGRGLALNKKDYEK